MGTMLLFKESYFGNQIVAYKVTRKHPIPKNKKPKNLRIKNEYKDTYYSMLHL